MNSRRLEAEVIRDSLLAVSGSLDPKMGGPELHEETDQDTPRRSLYFHITPSAQLQFLKVFDGRIRWPATRGRNRSCRSRRWRWPTAS